MTPELVPVLDTGACTGCGRCEELCPAVFKVKDGKSTVVSYQCDGCDCKQIEDECKVGAIKIYEDF
jgi:ferredoxin